MKPSQFFTSEQKDEIENAIRQAELNTSGEIRVHVEKKCKGNVLDRAAGIFALLQMHKTQLRNGVLFYISILDRQFAIIGDVGINSLVPANFWDEIKGVMLNEFAQGAVATGLAKGIAMSGEALKQHFPYQKGEDINELPDEISFGN